MKIILTGSTGVIGTEVLAQCIAHPAITSIIVLIRRPLPDSVPSSPKLKVVIQKDFLSYPPSVLEEFVGAEACIWAQGGMPSVFPTLEIAKEVNITYPVTFAQAVVPFLSPVLREKRKKFTMVYVSGHPAAKDQQKKLRIMPDARKIKGETENRLLELQNTNGNENVFEATFARVGSVIPRNNIVMAVLGVLTNPLYPAIGVEEFAAALIDVAVSEQGRRKVDVGKVTDDEGVILHEEMKRRGKEILSGVK
ncbi:hypothetical protein G7Y89_g15280 [Cudoniella acicularis]|uniref:NAD(P)-binding domain-containing protein n=1 Tax=Cudoniella acicularis TaxID=354080 RepID=A0A8H4VN17_9HELO|nr:hypothetical protein G7Y89_g15280 [Cudoniella acicularis]